MRTIPAAGSPSFTHTASDNADQHIAANADHFYGGQKSWSDASARVICKLRFYLTANNTISGFSYRAEVWSLSGNNLGTRLGFSAPVTGNNSWSSTAVYFDLSANAASVGASTPVALVLRRDDSGTDASNFVKMDLRETDGTLTGNFATWNNSGIIEFDGHFRRDHGGLLAVTFDRGFLSLSSPG